jgi:hypothetical protein
MKSTIKKLRTNVVQTTIFMLLVMAVTATVAAAQQPFEGHIDWAAHNTDAGGSVDCPGDYISQGVAYAIAGGGRAAVINAALFAAYNQDFSRAYTLVLLTQCHNSDARQQLVIAGQKAVLTYLVNNYQPTGIDPNQIIGLAQTTLQVLAATQ